ncbi:ABC transporter substrate-binding protein [Sphingomonas sp.]|uniref:ABC transporter substrate-binding protein n=1 Tax=Sphingomonas sp. TaxID=28214 RepID=UPI002FC71BD4
MTRIKLSFACWDYDRIRAIADGRIRPEGIDLNYMNLPVEETFFRMLRYGEFDVAEMSLSSYTVSLSRDPQRFIALPVFMSRSFRHNCIFVSTKSGIEKPSDLAGKRIGVPEYQMTAPVWIRGILEDEYGVDASSPTYFTGGEEQPGRDEKLKLDLPDKIKIQPIPSDKTLSQMLAEGEIDALHAPRIPSTFHSRPDAVRRLFDDPVSEEKAYYRKTGLFPIMHVIAIRRDVYESNRWIARSLYNAFVAAQQIAYEDLKIGAALKTSLPWQVAAVDETIALMGEDWWPYGLDANRKVLDTFLRYHHDQGLSPKRLAPEDLFAPETLEAAKI